MKTKTLLITLLAFMASFSVKAQTPSPSPTPSPSISALLDSAHALEKADRYGDALAILDTPTMLSSTDAYIAVHHIVGIKVRTHASDVLSWAKLAYFLSSFQNSLNAISEVCSAFRATDGNVTRANLFIQSQTDSTVTNPLLAVPFPTYSGTFPDSVMYSNTKLIISGSNTEALIEATDRFSKATDTATTNFAISKVAQTLRNIDENLIRANAYVTSQQPGQPPYVIKELSNQ